MKQSKFLSLNWRDTLRSAIVALLTALYYWLQDTFLPGLDLDPQIKALISAALAYFTKNLFTKPDVKKFSDDPIVGDRPKDRG